MPDYRPWLVVPLGLVVGMSVIFVAHMVASGSPAVGGDYGRYYTAAHLMLQGRNPYDQAALLRAEHAYESLSVAHALATSDGFVLLPFVIWPILLLVRLPFWTSYVILTVVATVAFSTTIALLARARGWTRWWIVAILPCFSWVFVWGRLVGQLDFVIPICLVVTAYLLARRLNYLAGVAFTGIWVQPELTWMAGVALVVLLARDHSALKQVLMGFFGASVVLFGISALVPHGMLVDWLQGGATFLHREGTHEYDLLGLLGLIQVLSPRSVDLYSVTAFPTLMLAAAGLVVASTVAVWMARSRAIAGMPTFEAALWRLFVPLSIWLLFTPYGHPNNAVILIPLVVLAVGADASGIATSAVEVALLSVAMVVAQFFSGTVLFDDLMPLATALLLVLVFRRLRQLEEESATRLVSPAGPAGVGSPSPV